jgi:branched-subunit amino acid transport protein
LRQLHVLKKILLIGSALIPGVASAMQRCPPEFGEKSSAFWVLGWAIFAPFVIAGALLPKLMFRATRSARPPWRWTLRIASIPAMLAMWLLGVGIFFGQFVMVC